MTNMNISLNLVQNCSLITLTKFLMLALVR